MKITEQHVSDKTLQLWLGYYNNHEDKEMVSVLLELVQRRAEDRQREASDT